MIQIKLLQRVYYCIACFTIVVTILSRPISEIVSVYKIDILFHNQHLSRASFFRLFHPHMLLVRVYLRLQKEYVTNSINLTNAVDVCTATSALLPLPRPSRFTTQVYRQGARKHTHRTATSARLFLPQFVVSHLFSELMLQTCTRT